MTPDLFSQAFLYQFLDSPLFFRSQTVEIPESITRNLNPAFAIREYQEEAFARFIHCFNEDFTGKETPLHLLFNMATGSGKTLIMAGLILYLYEQGYRNFLFFVNSTNIIKKTEDNFLNPLASKYLFNREIHIGGRRIRLTEVESFEGVNHNDINICFTTIQQLHLDMTTDRENALTLEDFADKKIVLLSDEAHHMNTSTQRELFESWEKTVERIFKSNADNLLLEFTATHDYENSAMVEKYRNKVVYRYDLKDFRNHRYSKDIELVRSDFGQEDRMLQAIILNHYKQHVAAEYGIQLKPVILFKAQKTIAQSRENKADFHKLIDELTGSQIDRIRASEVEVVQRAFRFFDENCITSGQLAQRLKSDFQERYCLSDNSKEEKETNQILVNTLEDRDNPIRAIFAVEKLNEGWDVLNLFDIVRCYETRDSRNNRPGKTTIREAQLIGRGARYFPFVLPESDDGTDHSSSDEKFQRKFDSDLDHDLRVLEELHYHSVNDSSYISEIRRALVEQGIIDETIVPRKLKLKDSFTETDLYKYGVVWLNERKPRDYQDVISFADLATLSVRERNHEHTIHGATGGTTTVMEDREAEGRQEIDRHPIRLVDIEQNIVQSAIARNPFFTFASLKRYFPQLRTMEEFRTSENYLGGLAITFRGDLSQLEDNPLEKLIACCDLLEQVESELRERVTDDKGTTDFRGKRINAIFTDKTLNLNVDSSRVNERFDERFIRIKDWFAFDALYGTSEERELVKLLDRWIRDSGETYEGIYLLRNERHFALYNFSDGRAFEPDFVLFLDAKQKDALTYQLFIEPKGKHLQPKDRWKESFLKEIDVEQIGGDYHRRLMIENRKYRIIGIPFFDSNRKVEFIDTLNTTLENAHNRSPSSM